MQTYRVFDCSHAEGHPSDVVFFGPRWAAQALVWWKNLGPGCWDYQTERGYQRHYARAKSTGEGC